MSDNIVQDGYPGRANIITVDLLLGTLGNLATIIDATASGATNTAFMLLNKWNCITFWTFSIKHGR